MTDKASAVGPPSARFALVEPGAAEDAAAALFPGAEVRALTRAELRPPRPFAGPLFELLAAREAGSIVGLVVTGVAASGRGPGAAPAGAAPQAAPVLLAVRDHVNLALRGPLTGRWPAGVPRSFPCMTGIYQPAAVRAVAGTPVYFDDVVVAGVADVGRLTPFERRALGEAGATAYADCLVPAVIAAAFYGLKVAACVVTQAARERE